MSEIANSVRAEACADKVDGALELRIFRVMIAMVALAVIAGAMFAPWRVTAGLMLGGMLSLLNYHWLRTSIAAVFKVEPTGKPPRVKISRFVFRYFVIGILVIAAYKLRVVSVPATIAGLCSFVPALFIEAFRQFYFAIIHREESY